jgi:hypothetical protein
MKRDYLLIFDVVNAKTGVTHEVRCHESELQMVLSDWAKSGFYEAIETEAP